MQSIGKQVERFLEWRGWKAADLARAIGGNVRRQHIEQLLSAPARVPRYIDRLAMTMGCTVDDLLKGRYAPPDAAPPLATVEAPDHQPQPSNNGTLSPMAIELAQVFDSLPNDKMLRMRLLGDIAEVLAPHISKKGAVGAADGTHG